MTTQPLIPISSPTPSAGSSSSSSSSKSLSLNPQDFIKMMVTQLQNQDPLQPASNSELLSQMSQIGQLQSSTDLQTSLKGMVMQNQIGAASGLIGKSVQGLDTNNSPVSGLVNSVKVSQSAVTLELDNGQSLALSQVTSISSAPAAADAGVKPAA